MSERIYLGTAAPEGFEMINSRVVGEDGNTLKEMGKLYYACTKNVQRISIFTDFLQQVSNKHSVY